MHEGYDTYFVCPPSANAIKRLYSILNTAIGFLLCIEGFQLTDLSKKAEKKESLTFTLCFVGVSSFTKDGNGGSGGGSGGMVSSKNPGMSVIQTNIVKQELVKYHDQYT